MCSNVNVAPPSFGFVFILQERYKSTDDNSRIFINIIEKSQIPKNQKNPRNLKRNEKN